MKATIEVNDRKEADAIKTGLEDPSVRAFVVIVGLLKPMSERARVRVLNYVTDALDEHDETKQGEPSTKTTREGLASSNGNPT